MLHKNIVAKCLLCLSSCNRLHYCVSKLCLIYFDIPFDIQLWCFIFNEVGTIFYTVEWYNMMKLSQFMLME